MARPKEYPKPKPRPRRRNVVSLYMKKGKNETEKKTRKRAASTRPRTTKRKRLDPEHHVPPNQEPVEEMSPEFYTRKPKQTIIPVELSSDDESILVYKKHVLTRGEFKKMSKGGFISDSVIDIVLLYLYKNYLSPQERAKTALFSVHFSTKLNTMKFDVRKRNNWTKSIDLFNKDYLVIPINSRNHWLLAIICFPFMDAIKKNKGAYQRPKRVRVDSDSDAESIELSDEESDFSRAHALTSPLPVKKPSILLFDSYPKARVNAKAIFSTLRKFLKHEWAVRNNVKPSSFSTTQFLQYKPIVPIQPNLYECGSYVIQYFKCFFKRPILNFTVPISLKHWFTPQDVSVQRLRIIEIFVDIWNTQGVDVDELKLPPLRLMADRSILLKLEAEAETEAEAEAEAEAGAKAEPEEPPEENQ